MIDKWVTRFNEIKNDFCFVYVGLKSILFSVGWPRLLSRVIHQSRDFLGSDVSLESQCGCHLRLFIECVCVWLTKALTMLAYCIAANCNNSQATQSITMPQVPVETTRCEAKMGQTCTIQTSWVWCCISVTPICVASNQSSKQVTPNERNKTAETTSKSQTIAYL